MKKERLDIYLTRNGYFESREKALREIMSGNVLVNEIVITKGGYKVSENDRIRVKESLPYVSRGALKLKYALEQFKLSPSGKIAMDVGASTGGFTEVLLENGATLVYAIDSGKNQLAWKLRTNPKVVVMEKTNARYIDRIKFDPSPEVATIDVSFISLTKILFPVKNVLRKNFWIVVLIKPQFELEPGKIKKGGVAKEEFIDEALEKVIKYGKEIGLKTYDVIPSPIKGHKSGNIEYLTYFTD